MSKKKIAIIATVVVLVLAGVGFGVSKIKKAAQYKTEKITKCSISQTVDASGVINPVTTVNIGTQVSGTISKIYVDYNSEVKKGQLLAEIDPALFQAAVERAQSDLAAAHANAQRVESTLAFDKQNYERYQKLYVKNYVSKSELDLAEANYKANSAQLNSMKAAINQTSATLKTNQTNLKYSKIISPVDGVVVSRNIDVGQTVAASFQTPTLFLVAQDLEKMQIEVNVSEADIGMIKVGQDVDYTLDGYPDKTFKGKITQVRISPTTVQNVVTYVVIVAVNNPDGILKPGMSANVSIVVNKKEDILCVPPEAFRFTPAEVTGGKKFKEQGIWVLRSGKLVRVKAGSGIKDADDVEVISKELNEGDEIITGTKDTKNAKGGGNRGGGRQMQVRMF